MLNSSCHPDPPCAGAAGAGVADGAIARGVVCAAGTAGVCWKSQAVVRNIAMMVNTMTVMTVFLMVSPMPNNNDEVPMAIPHHWHFAQLPEYDSIVVVCDCIAPIVGTICESNAQIRNRRGVRLCA